MGKWRDISTAPKVHGFDPIRVLATDGHIVSGAYWEGWRHAWMCEASVTTEYDSGTHEEWNPTHWQPLPSPPLEERANG